MATFTKRGKRWRAQVLVQGERRSGTFDTKAGAQRWALEEEASGKRSPATKMLVSDALKKLADEYINKGTHRGNVARIRKMLDMPIAKLRLVDVGVEALDAYRDERLQVVSEASVRREMNDLRGMFRRCREDWRWMTHNPFEGFKGPKSPESRKRRITDDEIQAIRQAFDIAESLNAVTATQRVGLAFLFALETAMRSGEIVGLEWDRVHLQKRYVHLPKTKNGDKRDVPLSTFAVQILEALPREDGMPCFLLNDEQRDAIWRKWRGKAGVVDLHFHDTRSEGIWRLSKKLDVLQLARAIGHRDINSLLIYYRESASDMAAKLD